MLNNCEAKGLGCVLTLPIYRGREQHGNGREAGDKGTGSGRVRYGRREVLTPLSPPPPPLYIYKEGNLPNLQPQRATYHHRSKQKDHQLPRRHFQPKQQHLPTLHKAQHHTTVRTPREQSSTDHHKEHTCRHQQTTFIPFIRQSFIRQSRSPVPEST